MGILTQGLQSIWPRKVLTGKVILPRPEVMEALITIDKNWKRSWMPKKGDRAAILQLHKMRYHDQLCGDMGTNRMRKGWNLLAKAFAPYSAADYADLFHKKEEKMVASTPCTTPTLLQTLGQDVGKGDRHTKKAEVWEEI